MLTTDDEYSRHLRRNLPPTFQIKFSKTLKDFCCIFIAFLEYILNLMHFFFKKMSFIAEVSLKLLTLKDVVTYMLT